MGERYDKTQTVAALINEDVEVINAYSFQLALLTKDCALLTYRSHPEYAPEDRGPGGKDLPGRRRYPACGQADPARGGSF